MVARICASEGGGRTAFAALKRYVFQGSMRAPVRRSTLGRFFGKVGLSLERCLFFFSLQHLSNGSPCFEQEAVPIRVPATVFQPNAFQPRGVAKIGLMRFSLVL